MLNKFCNNCECELKGKKRRNKYCSMECSTEAVYKSTDERYSKGLVSSPKTLKLCYIRDCGNVCTACSLSGYWNNKPLVLQLDHIDGDSDNNKPSNLRMLCPNCHTQTETYGSRGFGSKVKKKTKRNSYLQKYKSKE